MHLLKHVHGHRYQPLDEITFVGTGHLEVHDGKGKIYFSARSGDQISFLVGGAVGAHSVFCEGQLVAQFEVSAETKIDDKDGKFKELLTMLHYSILSEQGEEHTCLWNGKIYRYFICWLRDHVHILKAMKYFEPHLKSAIELYRDSQRPDGMIWDNVYRKGPDPTYWICRFNEGGFYAEFADGRFEFKRIPVENDVEYLFVEGIYYTWKATGDDAWMLSCLDSAIRALNYSIRDTDYRFSKKYGLLKRGYTIDTWDFQVEGDRVEGDIMRVRPGETRFGVMFGDNTGYAIACEQLSEMLNLAGRETEGTEFMARAQGIRKRLEEVSWRGTHYQHHVPEDLSIQRDLGVDESEQVSLSNAYSMNRNIGQGKARAIAATYKRLRDNLPPGSPGEWYTIYPPFQRGFSGHSSMWQYMNASVTPIVAGELARGAFHCGEEAYGADVLNRLIDLGKRTGNRFHCAYTGSLPEPPQRTFAPVDLTPHANVNVHGGAVGNVPGWPGAPGNDLRELPSGACIFSGADFELIDPKLNGDRGAIGLGHHEGYAQQVQIDVPRDQTHAKGLYFFHTMSENGGAGIAGTLTLCYSDGTEVKQYVQRGQNILGWWMPELPVTHGLPHLDIGWKGANKVLPYIGVSTWAFDNPHPERELSALVLEAATESCLWFVMGISLSDTVAWLPTSLLSFGIPNGWGAAAVVYALVEGLAGVVDKGRSFDLFEVCPRWVASGVTQSQVCIAYPASGGYVAYRFTHDPEAKEICVLLTSSASSGTLRILLPSGAEALGRCDTVEGSRYAVQDVTSTGPELFKVKYV
jgi:hypothetical protein